MTHLGSLTRITYTIPSRGLIGFSTNFMTLTKGYGIMNHTFKEYAPAFKLSSTFRPTNINLPSGD